MIENLNIGWAHKAVALLFVLIMLAVIFTIFIAFDGPVMIWAWVKCRFKNRIIIA